MASMDIAKNYMNIYLCISPAYNLKVNFALYSSFFYETEYFCYTFCNWKFKLDLANYCW